MKHVKPVTRSPAYAIDFDEVNLQALIDYIIDILEALKLLFGAKGATTT